MPLGQFIPTIRRVVSSSDAPTALSHPLVMPILRSVKDITSRYRNDIPQMIATGGTGEDAEEAMMLFAWTHEKRPDGSNEMGTEEERETRWVKRWLQRFERRECVLIDLTTNMWFFHLTFHSTMIQVLLHFLILSLPTLSSPSDKKRKRRRKREDLAPDLQEAFDVLTDRLCIWRDTDFISSEPLAGPSTFSERDWLQTFCEDVVRPAFGSLLPPLYESFRIKCFPESVGENDSDSEPDPFVTTTPVDMNHTCQSVTSTSNNSTSQLLNSRREVFMRRSMSVQRDIGAGVSLKGKERERQHQGAKRTGNGGGMMALSNKGGTCMPRSSSFSVLPDLQDHQQPKRSATTLVPETPATKFKSK